EDVMSRFAPLCVVGATLAIASTAHAQSSQLPQRWILAGDSIQAQVFGNAEFQLPGGDARDLTAAIIMQDTGVAIQNVSSPGATMSGVSVFAGLKDQQAMVSFIDGFFGATGIIITIGVNDAGGSVSAATYRADYASLVAFALRAGLQVICVP